MTFQAVILAILVFSARIEAQTCSKKICLSFDSTGKCKFCNNFLGYAGDGQGGCIFTDSQDCDRVDEGGQCVDCADGFLPFGGACRPVTGVDCLQFTAKNTCKLCPVGKAPIPNIQLLAVPAPTVFCQDVGSPLSHCRYYSAPTICLYCDLGFHLDSAGACVADIANCLVSAEGACQCPSNFASVSAAGDAKAVSFALALAETYQTTMVLTSRCVVTNAPGYTFTAPPVDANCQTTNPDNTCAECKPGYFLNAQKTCDMATGPLNCAVQSSTTTCLYCLAGYYPSAGGTSCDPYINHCKYYTAPADCLYCEPGYYRASATSCLSATAIVGCAIWSSSTNCAYCDYPQISMGTTCKDAVTQLHDISGANCNGYDINGCTSCSGDFYLDAATLKCTPATSIGNCAKYSAAATCLYCTAPYFLINNACTQKVINNCSIYVAGTTAETTCLYCKDGFYPATDGKSCLQLLPTETILSCMYYDSAKKCAICNAGYIASIDRATCTIAPSTSNCMNYSSTTVCSLCVPGYALDASKNCVITNQVLNCDY